jgi:hypothetical protein
MVCYLDPSTNTVKHASAICFDEYNMCLYESDKLSPGALILSECDPPDLTSFQTVNIIDHPHLETTPFIHPTSNPSYPSSTWL